MTIERGANEIHLIQIWVLLVEIERIGWQNWLVSFTNECNAGRPVRTGSDRLLPGSPGFC